MYRNTADEIWDFIHDTGIVKYKVSDDKCHGYRGKI